MTMTKIPGMIPMAEIMKKPANMKKPMIAIRSGANSTLGTQCSVVMTFGTQCSVVMPAKAAVSKSCGQ